MIPPPSATLKLERPISLGPATETWLARGEGRPVVVRRFVRLPPPEGWPPPPDPAVLRALNHPSVCRFLGVATDVHGVPCHVFERLEGRTLAARIATGGLDAPGVRHLLECGLRGLRWIHVRSEVSPRVHGDVSPANVLVLDDGRAKLLDLLATVPGEHPAGPGIVFGTLAYAAPEVLAGTPPDRRSDVWSLALLAVAASGVPLPWAGLGTPLATLPAIEAEDPGALAARCRLSDGERALVAQMLSRDPSLRPSAEQALRLLALAGKRFQPRPRA